MNLNTGCETCRLSDLGQVFSRACVPHLAIGNNKNSLLGLYQVSLNHARKGLRAMPGYHEDVITSHYSTSSVEREVTYIGSLTK